MDRRIWTYQSFPTWDSRPGHRVSFYQRFFSVFSLSSYILVLRLNANHRAKASVLGCLMASPFANVLIYHELTNKLNFQLHGRSEQKPAFNYQWSALLHAAVSCNFQAEELSTACQSIGYKLMCIMRTSAKVMLQTLLTKHRTTDSLKTIYICPENVRMKKMPQLMIPAILQSCSKYTVDFSFLSKLRIFFKPQMNSIQLLSNPHSKACFLNDMNYHDGETNIQSLITADVPTRYSATFERHYKNRGSNFLLAFGEKKYCSANRGRLLKNMQKFLPTCNLAGGSVSWQRNQVFTKITKIVFPLLRVMTLFPTA